MRDFRDAKAMAHTLRAALAAYGTKITVSQSLELIAKAFGVADWNTLSAAINNAPVAPPAPADRASPRENVRFSPELEATLQRSVHQPPGHKHAAPEHLLLALLDDTHAAAVMTALKVDQATLRRQLSDYLDSQAQGETLRASTPTEAFQRVIQRAILHTQSSGSSEITGANVLLTLFSERESKAVQLLEQQNISRNDVANFVRRGAGE